LIFFRVRSLKLSTVRLLVANGADPNIANNRGETATDIAEFVQADQQQNFINALLRKDIFRIIKNFLCLFYFCSNNLIIIF
jgi:ankyrin repeat protein